MSEQESREVALQYLRQVCFAVAAVLILYGIVQLLNFLLNLANIYVGYYLWIVFQIIAAILIVFIGFRVYSMAKTLKITNLTQLWKEVSPQLLALLLGSIVLLTVASNPFSASTHAFSLSSSILLGKNQHTAFIPRSWMEDPAFPGKATGFIYSWVTLENNHVVVHNGNMDFIWGNYSYRLFDLNAGGVYFTTEDARSRGIFLNPQNPFYLVYLEGARPKPYSFWSLDDLAISRIQIVEGSLQYPFVTGELLNNAVLAWNVVEAQYSSEIDSVIEGLNKIQYNTVKVFVRPFWSEFDKTLEIVIQEVTYYEGMLEWYVAPTYLLTVCFVFDNSGEYMRTYVVPPSMVAHS